MDRFFGFAAIILGRAEYCFEAPYDSLQVRRRIKFVPQKYSSVEPSFQNIQTLYKGFFIEAPIGNNAFSYSKRLNKKIFVPPLISGNLRDLAIGEEIAFSEIEDNKEINRPGLKNFLYWKPQENKHVFIFDNHNHAFFFWVYALKLNLLKRGGQALVHVDQHRDMRDPEMFLTKDLKNIGLPEAFEYTNHQLNVGNFIKPALTLKIFSEVSFVDSKESFVNIFPRDFVLDLDLDIFSPLMDYMDYEFKMRHIKNFIGRSNLIMIATSPYFMDQNKAIEIIHKLFET